MEHALQRHEDWLRRGAALSALFSLDQPVPPEVVVHMALNPNHSVNLWIARESSDFQDLLLELSSPPDLDGRNEDDLLEQADEVLEDIEAVIHMTVDNATLARRESICMACPNLKGTPKQLKALFSALGEPVAPGRLVENMICAACGCQLGRKLRWQTQNCPQPMPNDPTLSRWGEKM